MIVSNSGRPVDRFVGLLDEVRISRGVRYDGPFRPRGRLDADSDTPCSEPHGV